MRDGKCRKCLREGNFAKNCPNQEVCLSCKKPGHRRQDCWAKNTYARRAGAFPFEMEEERRSERGNSFDRYYGNDRESVMITDEEREGDEGQEVEYRVDNQGEDNDERQENPQYNPESWIGEQSDAHLKEVQRKDCIDGEENDQREIENSEMVEQAHHDEEGEVVTNDQVAREESEADIEQTHEEERLVTPEAANRDQEEENTVEEDVVDEESCEADDTESRTILEDKANEEIQQTLEERVYEGEESEKIGDGENNKTLESGGNEETSLSDEVRVEEKINKKKEGGNENIERNKGEEKKNITSFDRKESGKEARRNGKKETSGTRENGQDRKKDKSGERHEEEKRNDVMNSERGRQKSKNFQQKGIQITTMHQFLQRSRSESVKRPRPETPSQSDLSAKRRDSKGM